MPHRRTLAEVPAFSGVPLRQTQAPGARAAPHGVLVGSNSGEPRHSASSVRSVTSISRSMTWAGDSCGKFVSTTSLA
jgi:hypothetical protein